ncbi:PLDc N-terminal domain-containing protein [Sphingobacterium sp.]|uniref:PLDc N-terminal domain-containing protein n=1 Tax=Sphingobacterium sp. TaxID=341027 RepID=UPI003919DA07
MLLGVLPFFYTLFHIIYNKSLNVNQKYIWTFIILIGSLLGILIYWLWGRKNEPIGT